ncbi:hypothetical protein B0I35DRAFT_332385, partial [Stachybotrys elegans]
AGNSVVLGTAFEAIRRSLDAMSKTFGGVVLVWNGIFTNGVNQDTLQYILNTQKDLLDFVYDLVNPATVNHDGLTGEDNLYNELDLRQRENQVAVMNQLQRVKLTIIAIQAANDRSPSNELESLIVDAKLAADGSPPLTTYTSRLRSGVEPASPNEKWLFINGIANEFVWFQRSCDKIRDTFGREVKGIYNRTDGILWDLIECAGERQAVAPDPRNPLIQRTSSSKEAQESLLEELKSAIWPGAGPAPRRVMMIAHSQGCLVLRLALQALITANHQGDKESDLKKLGIFTFGNPSVDWKVVINGKEQPLSKYVGVTEHFALEHDYVAKLGVIRDGSSPNPGYGTDLVFKMNGGRGHLLGAHYSFDSNAYVQGSQSQLLRAAQRP